MTTKKTVRAWVALSGNKDRGGIAYGNGHPFIFIQKTRLTVIDATGKPLKVVPCTISYDLPSPIKKAKKK